MALEDSRSWRVDDAGERRGSAHPSELVEDTRESSGRPPPWCGATAASADPEATAPWLSIVIPTRNTRQLTLACLASLGDLSGGIEVVVVDDASTDGTAEAVAQRFPAVLVVRRLERGGFTVAANQGLGLARGELLLLLNSDTELVDDTLGVLREKFEESPELGIAGARLCFPDGTPQWSGGAEPSLAWLFGLTTGLPPVLRRRSLVRRLRPVGGHRGPVEWVTGAAMAMRRDVWAQVGPLDEGYALYCQDLDLCTRARGIGWSTRVLPDLEVLHHQGATVRHRDESMGIAARQDPGLLWTDLLLWSRRNRGDRFARRAARALCWGARLRLAARSLGRLLLSPQERPAWDGVSSDLRRALERVQGTGARS